MSNIKTSKHMAPDTRDDKLFPYLWGPWWLWVLLLLFISYGATREYKSRELPECDDSRVTAAIDKKMRASEQERADILGSGNAHSGIPAVGAIRQVSRFGLPGVRACAGWLTFGRINRPFGFALLRQNDQGAYEILGGAAAIIEERFGRLDRYNNLPRNRAEPLGQVALRKAFFAGIAQLPDAARERQTIDDLQSTSECVRVKSGGAYRCRLLVARDDPGLAAAGQPSATLLNSDFTFEQDAVSGAWRPIAGFANEYRNAVQAARTD